MFFSNSCFSIVSIKVSVFVFGLFRSVKVVTFMFLFWYLFIIIAIILDFITAIIGVDVFHFFGAFVDYLIKFNS